MFAFSSSVMAQPVVEVGPNQSSSPQPTSQVPLTSSTTAQAPNTGVVTTETVSKTASTLISSAAMLGLVGLLVLYVKHIQKH